MTIDFHVHSKITSKFPFNKEEFLLIIEEARLEGIDSLVLTEHCHADEFIGAYDFLSNNYPLIEDYYDVDGIKIFCGIEITTNQNYDFLVIGKPNEVLELRNTIVNELKYTKDIPIEKLFKLFDKEKFIIILSHPHREHDEIDLSDEILNKLDAIEYNARELYDGGIDIMKNRIDKLSKETDLPIVCGGDAHHFIRMGCVRNIFDSDCITVKQIKEQINLRNFKTEISPNLSIRVKSSIVIKKLMCNK